MSGLQRGKRRRTILPPLLNGYPHRINQTPQLWNTYYQFTRMNRYSLIPKYCEEEMRTEFGMHYKADSMMMDSMSALS